MQWHRKYWSLNWGLKFSSLAKCESNVLLRFSYKESNAHAMVKVVTCVIVSCMRQDVVSSQLWLSIAIYDDVKMTHFTFALD